MEFRILGPLEALDGSVSVPLVGTKQRLLLALLLAAQGRRVPRDHLVEALWPEQMPRDGAHALDQQVSRLRKAIGVERIVTSDGYRVELAGDVLDAERFSALVSSARDRPADEAAARLRQALGLWRGGAFGDLADETALCAAADALEASRVAAWEELFDAELTSRVSGFLCKRCGR